MTNVLIVCMGNICRSPMAMIVVQAASAKRLAAGTASMQFGVDAAGTHAHHSGVKMDSRASSALTRRGYIVGKQRSRRINAEDFARFDLILAMDDDNLIELQRLCPPEYLHKLRRFLDFAAGLEVREVPDPYYGSVQGFERVLDLCEVGAEALLDALNERAVPSARQPASIGRD